MEGDDILIIHRTDYKNMARWVLEQAGVTADIGGTNKKVALKPSLVTAKAPSSGVTTHNELLTGVIGCLQEHGLQNIAIIKGSRAGNHTEDTFRTVGYRQVCSRYDVLFVDLRRDTWEEHNAGGMKVRLRDKVAAADYAIDMPVLKRHYQIAVTRALKNDKGAAPNSEKRHFHTLGLHKPIAHLNIVAHNDFVLMDSICDDLDFEGGGNPMIMNRVLGSKGPVLCDAFVCGCIGYSVNDVSYITMAQNLGVGSTDTAHANMVYLNRVIGTHSRFCMTRRAQHLAVCTAPEDAYNACYGSLIYAPDRLSDMECLRRGLPPACIGQGCREQGDVIDVS